MLGPRRSKARGFTLVELMVVVVIASILAILGVVLLRNHLRASRSGEVKAMVQSIRAAQERYRAENRQYLDVSTTLTNYYPAASDGTKRAFYLSRAPNDPVSDLDRNWRMLGPVVSQPVLFGYAVVAGPGELDTELQTVVPGTTSRPTWPNPAETGAWYVIQAAGDIDNDGTKWWVLASSFSAAVYMENEGE